MCATKRIGGLLLCLASSVCGGQTAIPLPLPKPLLSVQALPLVSAHPPAPAQTAVQPVAMAEPVSAKTCEELYREITSLVEHRQTAEKRFWEDRKNQVAGVAGFVFTPAWLFVGVNAAMHLQKSETSFSNRDRIAELRMVSADKLCFVR